MYNLVFTIILFVFCKRRIKNLNLNLDVSAIKDETTHTNIIKPYYVCDFFKVTFRILHYWLYWFLQILR